jgi:hypothetical protein
MSMAPLNVRIETVERILGNYKRRYLLITDPERRKVEAKWIAFLEKTLDRYLNE